MVICNLKHLPSQILADARMKKGIDFLLHQDLKALETGTTQIQGEEVYARVMSYATLPYEELKFEAHKKYIDVHYVVTGNETIWCIDKEKMEIYDQYDPKKDVFHGTPNSTENVIKVVLNAGDLAVLYPSDAHAPKGIAGGAQTIDKVVLKILV